MRSKILSKRVPIRKLCVILRSPVLLSVRVACYGFQGAVVGGLATLVCSYMVRLQRKHELVLANVFEDDLIASWSDPTPEKHAAATVVQGAYR